MAKTATTRKQMPRKVEADVLINCRRRCCLCYFWDGNSAQQPGQIAHIDRDRANNSSSNLAYLCFTHHNLYDSNQQQGKNITPDELRHARNQLHAAFNPRLAFQVPLRLNCDDDDDAQESIDRLMALLKCVTDSDDIDLLDVRPGSLLVTVRLNAEQTRRVFEELDSVDFDELGVTGATVDHVEDAFVPESENQLAETVALIRERIAVLESSIASFPKQLQSSFEQVVERFVAIENRVDVIEDYVDDIVGDMQSPATAVDPEPHRLRPK